MRALPELVGGRDGSCSRDRRLARRPAPPPPAHGRIEREEGPDAWALDDRERPNGPGHCWKMRSGDQPPIGSNGLVPGGWISRCLFQAQNLSEQFLGGRPFITAITMIPAVATPDDARGRKTAGLTRDDIPPAARPGRYRSEQHPFETEEKRVVGLSPRIGCSTHPRDFHHDSGV